VQGRQVTLDSADGDGVLMTVDPLEKVPTGAQFLAESRAWLEKQKGRIGRVVQPQPVAGARGLEHFALEVELGRQQFWMSYYVLRQGTDGATLAARLLPMNATAVEKEVDAIARSLRLR
jgi:hypothetical protein